MYMFLLSSPGPRPPYYEVAHHLWGADCNFDSDGDSYDRETTQWTELTVALRPDLIERVDVDPIDKDGPLVLKIESMHEELARRAAEFLRDRSGGTLTRVRGD